jgi:hypothetical protein
MLSFLIIFHLLLSLSVFTDIMFVSKKYTNFMFYNLNKLIDNSKNDKNDNDRKIVIQLSCRLILRINITLLLKFKKLNNIENFDMDYIVSILLETIKIIFQFLQNSDFYRNNVDLADDDRNLNLNNGGIMNKKELLSYGDLGNILNDFIFQNNIDLLLEFQFFLWTSLFSFVNELINGNDKDDDEYCDDGKKKILLLLLDTAVFSAGIIRYIIYIHVDIYTYMYRCMCICVCIYTGISIYVYMHIHTYVHSTVIPFIS